MTTIRIRDHHLYSEQVASEVATWNRTGEIISDAAAVTIASWWQAPARTGYILAGLASGARVDVTELADDIAATLPEATEYEDRAALLALSSWLTDRTDDDR